MMVWKRWTPAENMAILGIYVRFLGCSLRIPIFLGEFCNLKFFVKKKKNILPGRFKEPRSLMVREPSRSHRAKGEGWLEDAVFELLYCSMWWFHTFFIFTPTWGNVPT